MNQEIKDKILAKYPTGTDNALYLSTGAIFGYSLAAQQLLDKEKEIERLKGLIEVAYKFDYNDNHNTIEYYWQQFKLENNL